MTKTEEKKVSLASSFAEFFEIDLTIKLFGKVIFSWHFPPKVDEAQ